MPCESVRVLFSFFFFTPRACRVKMRASGLIRARDEILFFICGDLKSFYFLIFEVKRGRAESGTNYFKKIDLIFIMSEILRRVERINGIGVFVTCVHFRMLFKFKCLST